MTPSRLSQHLTDYLAVRRALGFKLVFPGQVLPQFVAYLETAGASTVTVELAVAWAALPQGRVQPISLAHRLGAVRGFARWLATIDPTTEIPPCGIWSSTTPRPAPYLWTETEIQVLLDAARQVSPPLRAATHHTLFGLLACSGMRVGEAIGLARPDVDLDVGLITVRDGKFGRSRLVPLHPTTTEALRSYTICRDRLCPNRPSTAFFVSTVGTALSYSGVHKTFVEVTDDVPFAVEVQRWPQLVQAAA
ncbi:MAG: tyrosine-type recombinase/integrase [Actinomycetota bacterium]|nr:tyrosine-type recombinase/integrase [Actinomycetota bacterium]